MATVAEEIPPLAHGDNLSREEFLRIWEMHPEITKAELIGGIVYMPSPLSLDHGEEDSDVGAWLSTYKAHTPGCGSARNVTTFVMDDTLQPDLNLRLLPEYGGASWPDGLYLAGAPELITEIRKSSKAYDLHQKYDLYEQAGIQEYLAVLLYEKEIRWHFLKDGSYQLLAPGPDQVRRSRVFPGLWLDGPALLAGKLAQVLAKLQEGLASPEHEHFVKALAQRRAQNT